MCRSQRKTCGRLFSLSPCGSIHVIGSNYLYSLSHLRSPMHIYSGMFLRRSKIRWTISEEVTYSGSLALSKVLPKLFLDFGLLPFSNNVIHQGQNWMPLRPLSESTATSIVGKGLSLAGILDKKLTLWKNLYSMILLCLVLQQALQTCQRTFISCFYHQD